MKRTRTRSLGATILAATVMASLLTLGGSVATVGYIDQTQIQVILSGPNVVRCNRAATVSARVVSTKSGKPVGNQIVKWSLAGRSGDDGISAGSTVTNRRGRTAVTVSFGPVEGSRTVRAGAGATSPSITIRCAGGLPRTPPLLPTESTAGLGGALLATSEALGRLPSGDPLPATGIRLERLGIDLPLVEGDGMAGMQDAASHYPGTAWPGEGSNTFIYAHAREGEFLDLWKVRTGDLVEVTMADGQVVEHRVSEIRPMVAYDDLDVLAATDEEILTLQTCLTYDDTAPRFVVIAERVDRA
jgi:LPXTG-site transpeptidase (sortase) family protein